MNCTVDGCKNQGTYCWVDTKMECRCIDHNPYMFGSLSHTETPAPSVDEDPLPTLLDIKTACLNWQRDQSVYRSPPSWEVAERDTVTLYDRMEAKTL